MNAKAARQYSSPLRAEQAEQTRDRIVQAAVDLMNEADAGDVSMNEVAERAGVSVRTVYRNFATRDELLDGVNAWIGERLMRRVGPVPTTREVYERSTPDLVRAVFEIEPLYRALLATAAGRESHLRTSASRRDEIETAFADELRGMSDDQAERFSALVHLLSSSRSVLFIKDYWGLSPDDIGDALQWGIAALADAARDKKRKGEL